MKKIVALVLAMVMVLGLATTAFAAKMGYWGLENALEDAGWDYNVEMDDAEDAKDETFATYEIEAVAKWDDAVMWWASQTDVEKGDDFDLDMTFVKVASEEYCTVALVDGKVITYFVAIDDELQWDGKATKVVLPALPLDKADYKCNTLYNNTTAFPGTFYFFDDALWVSVTNEEVFDDDVEKLVLNVDGVAVIVREADEGDIFYSGHEYEVVSKSQTNPAESATKVYCQRCKAEFKFVAGPKSVAVATFGAGNFDEVYITDEDGTETLLVPGLWIEHVVPANWPTATVTAPAVDGDKVESPKTFDAGIAMYVGMSVMAAAGSAVVLKKKD